MGWFSGLGHDISDLFSGAGKAIDRAGNWVAKNPFEAAALVGGAAFGGAAFAADAGAADAAGAAGAAGAGAAGAGAADAGAVGEGSVNLFADAVPGAAGDVGATAADTAALGSAGAYDASLSAIPGLATAGADGSLSFLPATGAAGADGLGSLTPELASQLGVSAPGGFADLSLGGDASSIAFDAGSTAGSGLADGSIDAGVAPSTSSGFGGVGTDPSVAASPDGGAALNSSGGILDTLKGYGTDVEAWAKAHPAQAAMLGFAAKNALTGGKLPAAAQTASGASAAEVQQAQGILASGGQSSPLWAAQKASIDSSINANLANAIEAAKQSAASNGMGGTNSAVVQAQINKLTSDANTQKQQLYAQALNSIVSQAVSELSGGNATLTNIAQMQMRADQQAQATAAQTAELALGLGSLKNTVPASPSASGGP